MAPRVLVVDDSALDRALIGDTLSAESAALEVTEASSVRTALDAVKRDHFDLVIVDHHMADGTGLDVLRGLREAGHQMPAIYLTSELSRDVIGSALTLGASHYLSKDASYPHLLGPVAMRSLELEKIRAERAEAVAQLARAEAASRVRTDFLQKVTHELRTPMSAILGYTDCLIEGLDGPLSTRQAASLERVRRNARRLLAFINELLDFSALEAAEITAVPAVFRLAELLEELAAPARGRLPHGVQLVVACAPQLTVRCDRKLLGRAIGHLLDNAARFTQEGHVRLEAHADPVAAGLVHIAVTDTGVGIPPQMLDAVREPFRQGSEGLDRSHEGLGLGLALVERIARLMQGELEVESAPGAGSTFRLALPVLEPDTQGMATSWPPMPSVAVLAVDRDSETHALATKILAPSGMRVTGVLSVAFGLALMPQVRPSAILLDLATARAEEGDVLERFRAEARRRDIPLVMVHLAGESVAPIETGGHPPIEKPFHPEELVERVRALIPR